MGDGKRSADSDVILWCRLISAVTRVTPLMASEMTVANFYFIGQLRTFVPSSTVYLRVGSFCLISSRSPPVIICPVAISRTVALV